VSADSTPYSSTASVQYILVLRYNNEANEGVKGEENEATSGADWILGENECAVCDIIILIIIVCPRTGHEVPEGE